MKSYTLGPRSGTFGKRQASRPTVPAFALDDYKIYASYRLIGGLYFGTLKVVRVTDLRVLFPFEGAPELGPYVTSDEAKEASQRLGTELAYGDLAHPE